MKYTSISRTRRTWFEYNELLFNYLFIYCTIKYYKTALTVINRIGNNSNNLYYIYYNNIILYRFLYSICSHIMISLSVISLSA